MDDGYKNEAEGYASSLRQQAEWEDIGVRVDSDELRATADFIERQQAEIEALKHDIDRHLSIISAQMTTGNPLMARKVITLSAESRVALEESHMDERLVHLNALMASPKV